MIYEVQIPGPQGSSVHHVEARGWLAAAEAAAAQAGTPISLENAGVLLNGAATSLAAPGFHGEISVAPAPDGASAGTVVERPEPSVAPAPETSGPANADFAQSAPAAAEPAPAAAEPAPAAAEPAPAAAEPAPVAAEPAPVAAEPAPVAAEPAPVAAEPAPVAAEPAPAAAEPAPAQQQSYASPAPAAQTEKLASVSEEALEDVFLECSQIFQPGFATPDVIDFTIDLARRYIPSEHAGTMIVGETNETFYFAQARGPQRKQMIEVNVPIESGFFGATLTNNVPIAAANVGADRRHDAHFDQATGISVRSIATAPITKSGRTFGVMALFNREEAGAFSDYDLNILAYIAGQLGEYIQRNIDADPTQFQ